MADRDPYHSARTCAEAGCARPVAPGQGWDGQWWTMPKKMSLQCCDCGLVHDITVRVRHEEGVPVIQMRMDVNARATAAVRRATKNSSKTP